MKKCLGCRYAEWQKMSNGRLHPSGDGRCSFPVVMPVMPVAFYFVAGPPKPSGGYIRRNEEFNDHCPCFNPPNNNLSGGR